MNRRLRICRPSAATVLAVVAIVLACTGSAFAGSALIGGQQIRDNSLTGKDVKDASIHRSDLAADATSSAPITVTREAHQMGAGPVSVTCQAGEHVTGGGGNSPQMFKSQPHQDVNGATDGWIVQGRMPDPQPQGDAAGSGPVAIGDQITTAYVICAR